MADEAAAGLPAECAHVRLCTTPSAAYFQWPSLRQRLLAATPHGKPSEMPGLVVAEAEWADSLVFPGPLVLPGDDLDVDPEADPDNVQGPQTLRDWFADADRNPVTPRRRTVYVAASPDLSARAVRPMTAWVPPRSRVAPPTVADACAYLGAFWYGLAVRPLPPTFRWAPWEGYHGAPVAWEDYIRKKRAGQPVRIGLATPDALVGVRCRPAPDGASAMQVHLDDVLDALLEQVPADTYAVVLLLDLDMYEDDDDDDEDEDGDTIEVFTGGRAYGGSRIAVVNGFREHPAQVAALDRAHQWPASHCAAYVEQCVGKMARKRGNKGKRTGSAKSTTPQTAASSSSPLAAAVAAAAACQPAAAAAAAAATRSDWFARLMKTATHELGHCLGLEHCVYYACIAQGCASAAESLRQPAYLCPVCVEKVGRAIVRGKEPMDTQGDSVDARRTWAVERDRALLAVCRQWAGGGMLDGLAAWLAWRLERREGPESGA